ncbi:hypothetical protein PUN28_014045 [Cardiocondyla obscurior]|uniref:Heparanase n=1 Tax=Cardiocondyla obscurior TaxID=286306 RepID=A0AAW2F5R6_9HYME
MTYFVNNDWTKSRYQNLNDARIYGGVPASFKFYFCISLVLCSMLLIIVFLKMPYLYNSDVQDFNHFYKLHFDKYQTSTISKKFMSFGLDTSLLRKMNELPIGQKKFINLARHLSPAYVRVGGTSADCLTFLQDQTEQSSSEKIISPVDGQDISNFTISGTDLLAVYNFTVKSKLRMIFDLNVLLRNPDGSWNDSNAKEIIAYAKNHGMKLDWQLGNEPNSFKHVFNVTITATELAKDYDHLRQLLNEAGYGDSILVGPEVNHIGEIDKKGEIYAKTFLRNQTNTVNYVSWHQYYLNGQEATVDDFVNPTTFNWLPKQISSLRESIAESGKDVSMWLSETSTAFGGGAPGLSDKFVAGFLWLDKLGYSAKEEVKVVTRQSLFGGNYSMVSPDLTPNPDWWVSVFYKLFVSEKVLKLTTSDMFGYLRFYAHCTPKKAFIKQVSPVTIYGMNMMKVPAKITIPKFSKTMKILFYALTADHLQSSKIWLNDEIEPLKLRPNGDLPPFKPIILDPAYAVQVPPYSMVFMIIQNIDIPDCE